MEWPQCCDAPMEWRIPTDTPIKLTCSQCDHTIYNPERVGADSIATVRDMDVIVATALAILEDPERIDPFARRDALELLRGFIDRTK